ncbi:SsgA family sporulation/cell division regulator [Kitasatospora purpeofusca]|uniref:SsgA family sporulation/cell division regulator n=1 Tax=Kitasatospora purpeofusca TaxID=67352 RepID=UPI003864A14C
MPTAWVSARDLLAVGVSQLVGAGDVCVHPDPEGRQPAFIPSRGQEDTCVLRAQTSGSGGFQCSRNAVSPPARRAAASTSTCCCAALLEEDPSSHR